MKEAPEIHESPDKLSTKISEKKIETFDDLETPGKNTQIETFDDIAKSKEGAIHDGRESVEGKYHLKDTPEVIEQERLGQAAGNIKKIDWMKPEKWKKLSNDEKSWALRHSGEALRDAYHTPDPPLYTEEAASNELGKYGDGYYSDPADPSNLKKYVGSDYGITMNKEGVKDIDKRLFGDDPKVALETYAHEFRHSYQTEQVHAFDKGFKTDNPEKAKEWSENLKDYQNPPIPELAKTNPDMYFEKYEAYRNQPVEKDAREFAGNLSSRIYDENER